jgi:hypothetical protein
MLILDTRLGPRSIRPLSAPEAWKVCSLSDAKLRIVLEHGWDPQPLAGNSIPCTLTSTVGARVMNRLQAASDMESTITTGEFTWHSLLPALSLSSHSMIVVQLLG